MLNKSSEHNQSNHNQDHTIMIPIIHSWNQREDLRVCTLHRRCDDGAMAASNDLGHLSSTAALDLLLLDGGTAATATMTSPLPPSFSVSVPLSLSLVIKKRGEERRRIIIIMRSGKRRGEATLNPHLHCAPNLGRYRLAVSLPNSICHWSSQKTQCGKLFSMFHTTTKWVSSEFHQWGSLAWSNNLKKYGW